MSKRINAICQLIPRAKVIADIGCDHGKVCEFVVRNNLAKKLIACDKSEGSLEKCKERLSKIIVKNEKISINCKKTAVEFFCTDGENLFNKNISCAIIAGMGGKEIEKIVCSIKPKTLITSAHNYVFQLRRALWEMGYVEDKEIFVEEKRKSYLITRWQRG